MRRHFDGDDGVMLGHFECRLNDCADCSVVVAAGDGLNDSIVWFHFDAVAERLVMSTIV